MAAWEDVIKLGRRFPGVEEATSWRRPALKVAGRFMCALRTDPDAFVFRVIDVADQQALVRGEPDVFFITPHYKGYPVVLVRFDVGLERLAELVEDAWRIQAPKRLVQAWESPPSR